MKRPDVQPGRTGRRWPIAAMVLFFPLVGGLAAVLGAGSTQVAEARALREAAAAPAGAGGGAGLAVQTRNATEEALALDLDGGIRADGLIESTLGGFRFPDGSIQTTAASPTGYVGTGPPPATRSAASLVRSRPHVLEVSASGAAGHRTIAGALASIDNAGPANRYRIRLAAGTYREQVRLKPYVELEGAGARRTAIVAPGGGTGEATVTGAPNAVLRGLRVESTGGGPVAVAIRSNRGHLELDSVRAVARDGEEASIAVAHSAGSLALRDVIAEASGGDEAIGVRSERAASLTLANVTVRAGGAARQNVGVSLAGAAGSGLEMTDVEIEAAGPASFNTGLVCAGLDEIFLDGLRVRATGAEVVNESVAVGPASGPDARPVRATGLWLAADGGEVARSFAVEGRSMTVRGSHLTAEGAFDNTGLWVRDGVATGLQHRIRLVDSTIVADGQTVWSESPETTVRIGHSTLEGGGVYAERGTVACAATIDEDWTFLAEGCPP